MKLSRTDLADEIENTLRQHVLGCWFPRCIDHKAGGFQQNFSRDWTPSPDTSRFVVFQARMTWVAATVARERPDLCTEYTQYADHGLNCLQTLFRDSEMGGFYIDTRERQAKHSYAISFAIYACAAHYRLTGNTSARELALETFRWWVRNAKDPLHQGVYDVMHRDGTPNQRPEKPPVVGVVPARHRSSNTHIHEIEALTELFVATADEDAGRMLQECLFALEHAVNRDRGRMYRSYTRGWIPKNRTVSYGHDIETLSLCLDARRALNLPLQTPAVELAQRVYLRGLDQRYGGIFDKHRQRRFVRNKNKIGWVQAEGLLGFLYLHTTTADDRYWHAVTNIWMFIQSYIVDPEFSGMFEQLNRRGQPQDDRKGHQWKACYHFARALLGTSCMLRRQSNET